MKNRKTGALFHVVRAAVRRLRTDKAWTQQQLADKMGIHSMDVCRFERGITHQDMKLSRVEAYALALGVRPADLLDAKAAPAPAAVTRPTPMGRKPVKRAAAPKAKAVAKRASARKPLALSKGRKASRRR